MLHLAPTNVECCDDIFEYGTVGPSIPRVVARHLISLFQENQQISTAFAIGRAVYCAAKEDYLALQSTEDSELIRQEAIKLARHEFELQCRMHTQLEYHDKSVYSISYPLDGALNRYQKIYHESILTCLENNSWNDSQDNWGHKFVTDQYVRVFIALAHGCEINEIMEKLQLSYFVQLNDFDYLVDSPFWDPTKHGYWFLHAGWVLRTRTYPYAFDCASLVGYVINFPEQLKTKLLAQYCEDTSTIVELAEYLLPIDDDLLPGDILCWRNKAYGHAAIFICYADDSRHVYVYHATSKTKKQSDGSIDCGIGFGCIKLHKCGYITYKLRPTNS